MVFSHSTSSQLTQELQVILGVYRQEPGAPRSPPLATLIPCLLLTAQLSYLGPCQSPMGHACVCPSPLMNPFLGFITFLVAITCWPWAQEELGIQRGGRRVHAPLDYPVQTVMAQCSMCHDEGRGWHGYRTVCYRTNFLPSWSLCSSDGSGGKQTVTRISEGTQMCVMEEREAAEGEMWVREGVGF